MLRPVRTFEDGANRVSFVPIAGKPDITHRVDVNGQHVSYLYEGYRPTVKRAEVFLEEYLAEQKYIKDGGTHCPYCGSEQIEGGSISVEGGCCWQKVWCNACGAEWDDIYHLARIELVERGNV